VFHLNLEKLNKLKALGTFTIKDAMKELDLLYNEAYQFIHYTHVKYIKIVDQIRVSKKGRPQNKYEVSFHEVQSQD
jgi:hypothetical protein